MNWKKKLKAFFTMKRRANDGFTLVELIVVIAILAILGGVAVPAYSGYVMKAEAAADEALLAEVNLAFASACALNGDSHINNKQAKNQTLNGGQLIYDGPYAEDFNSLYEGGQFKTYTALMYNSATGTYTAGTDVGGGYVISNEDLNKLLGSSWIKMDSKELIAMVGLGADVVSEMDDFATLVASDAFKKAAAEMLGVENYDAYVANLAASKLKEQGLVPGSMAWNTAMGTTLAEVQNTIDKNMMVMLSAKDAQAAGKDIISVLTTSTNPKGALIGNLESNQTLGLSQTALTYGLYTAYMESTGGEADVLGMISALESKDAGFMAYLNGGQAQKDLDGVLAAMNVINSQNSDVIQSTAVNGITNNKDLEDALAAIWGQSK